MCPAFVSTSGFAKPASFKEVTVGGLASDGGLHLLLRGPSVDPIQLAKFRNWHFIEIAIEIPGRWLGDAVDGIDIAVAAIRKISICGSGPKVILATADAAKFPATVYRTTGQRPEPPERLRRQLAAWDQFETMNSNIDQLWDYIVARVSG